MNNALVTTGIEPLTIGSTELFEDSATLNGIPWDLTGGVANLLLRDPLGNLTTIPAVITGGVPRAPWTVAAPVGTWTRSWQLQDASGIVQISRPIVFTVISSP